MTIYIFGNELIEKDNLPFKLLPELRKIFPEINFIHIDPNEDFLPDKNQPLIIIDTVAGINEVSIFHDLDKFILNRSTSPHDYDLGFHLKLLEKMGELGEVKIIGLPQTKNLEEVLKQVEDKLRNETKNLITTI